MMSSVYKQRSHNTEQLYAVSKITQQKLLSIGTVQMKIIGKVNEK